MPQIPVLHYQAVLDAVSPVGAIDATRQAFLRHHAGEWFMPPKVYLENPPFGDFRAMPALGGGLAVLKWVTSFPGNHGTAHPTVTGVVCVSDARTGETLLILDARAVTALRTGAAAAVASAALTAPGGGVGIIGCGVHGTWAARCLHAAGFGPGVCSDPDPDATHRLAEELSWSVGPLVEARDQAVVCCVTPGRQPVIDTADLRPGQHFNMLGADGPGKAEATVDAVLACHLFCDEWEQASHGGELAGACAAGRLDRDGVIDLGAVLAGEQGGRTGPDDITMFDSTGLAIQDLGIAHAALAAWRDGRVEAQTIDL
ncbi:MAG TPA: hypothetical protein VG435_08110 [Acidimicrobiales bacterium]|jgi:ornithine cyclodeaminase/alanine dehydrogenase-like protein (mu-crystallin family)|nr:hypothetical protein [Acidimicrobiales bacterium]